MSDLPLGPRLLSGVQYYLLGQIAVVAVNLFATPLIVHGLGPDGYALYTFMWTLSGYLIVLNIGTSITIQRYVAYYTGKGELPRLSSLLRRLLAFHIVMSLVAAGLLLAGKDWFIVHLLHTHGAVLNAAPGVLLCVAVATPAYFVLQFALNVLYGMQRFGTYNFFFALQSLLVAVCAAALLLLGKGLPEIAVVFIVAHAALAAGALWSIRSALTSPGLSPTKEELSEISAFSLKNLANTALWTLIFQGDRAFIGSRLPLAQLGFYIIPASLAQKFNTFSGAAMVAANPMIAELHGRGQEERLRRLYLKASELSLFFLLPLSILAFVLAPQFLTLWLGEEFSRWGTWPMRLLLLSNLIYFATLLPNNIAVGKGRPGVYTFMQTAKVVILVVAWLILLPRYGIIGAASGALLAEILCAPFFVGYVHKRFLAINWKTFFSEVCARPVIAGAGLAVLGMVVHGRAGTWPRFIACGVIGGALYLAIGYRLLEPEAKALLSDWLRRKI